MEGGLVPAESHLRGEYSIRRLLSGFSLSPILQGVVE